MTPAASLRGAIRRSPRSSAVAHRIRIGAAAVGGVHVGQLALHQLELADRLAELLALVQVGHHHVQAGRHDAQRAAGQHRALVVEAAISTLTRDRCRPARSRRHLAVLGTPVRRCWNRACRACRASARCRNPSSPFSIMKAVMPAPGLDVGLGVDHQHVGIRAVGDPHLAAVEHPAVALPVGAQCMTPRPEPALGSLIASAPTNRRRSA